MTPRSRKPLIITSEQRDLPETTETKDASDMYQSLSPKNDSDFVSSDDDMSRSTFLSERYCTRCVVKVIINKWLLLFFIIWT